ncbi:hypothetical protein N431DRAFT_495412 [Stipitochalara longipes BDJ]|nr:hypothetical protein N431DRAFT_495412 [Stipitochalara longipes BDJ]
MHLSLPTLLTLSLASFALARPTQTVVACLSFTGYVSTEYITLANGTMIEQPYTITATLLSSSSTDPANASTLAVVCTFNGTFNYFFIGQGLDCVTGYTAHFFWSMREVSFTTPSIRSFLGEDPAFVINSTVRSDGNGTDYSGVFGCDGGNDTVTAWYNWGGF